MPPDTGPGGGPALIAGYRVLRRLRSSDRADLYVGVAQARPTSPGREVQGEEPAGSAASVVLKVFHPEADDLSVEREVRALTTLTPGRLARLHDVGTLPDGRTCLVLEQLTGGALSGFLEGRRLIQPGEAVTILAPVAAALAELQAIGLMHPAVTLSTIVFDSRGRPVLTGLGELRPLSRPGQAHPEAPDRADSRLVQVVRAVLDQVDPGAAASPALRELDRWCALPAARSSAGVPGELEQLLFAWAEAAPVRLGQTGATREAVSGPQSAGDWLRRPVPDDPAAPEPVAVVREAAGGSRAKLVFDNRVAQAGAVVRRLRDGTPTDGLKMLWGNRFRFRRGPMFLAALVVVVSIGLALTALGPGGSATTAGTQPEASPEPVDATLSPAADPATPSVADADGPDSAALSGEDPVAAVPALLRIRARCLGEVSVVCLDGVHQPQSAALAADSYAVRMMQQGGGTAEGEDLSSWAAVLVERTGDVSLVSLHAPDAERQPASVLVVKGEAGWRIREIFDY